MLWNTRDCDTSVPKDKVFAILGLVANGHESGIEVDYSKDMLCVFKETASAIITQKKSLNILLAGCDLSQSEGMPSWVPDWRREANSERPTLFVNRKNMLTMYTSGSLEEEIVMVEHGYKASGCIRLVFSFSEDLNILRVSCKIIDMIAKVDDVHSENTSKEISQSAIKLVRENAESLSMKLSSTGLEAKVREVLVVGKSGGYVDWYRDEVIQNVMNRRRFFITKAGNFGVGPAGTKEGQIVCVIAGCNFPIILCEEGDQYLLAG